MPYRWQAVILTNADPIHWRIYAALAGAELSQCVYILQAIEEPFITAVKQTLGDKFNPNIERIYRRATRFILTTLIGGFNMPMS